MKLFRLLPTPAMLALLVMQASAVDFASDTFELSDHATGARTVASGGLNGIPFFTRNATGAQYTAAITDDSGPGGLGSMVLSHRDMTTGSGGNQIIGVLPLAIVLAAQGDFITLSFDFRYTNIGTTTAINTGFRFGLEGSNGTTVTGDNQGATSDNDRGYYVQTGVGTTAPANNNTLYRENGGTPPILGGLDRTAITSNTAGATFNDNAAHSVLYTITRGAGLNMNFTVQFDGGTPITGTTTTSPYYTYDEVIFASAFVANPVHFNIDNVEVVSNVPEPGVTSCLLAGVALLAGRRRRGA